MQDKNPKSGFTILELMVVTAIIAVLSLAAGQFYFSSVEDADRAVLRSNVKSVREALGRYFKDRMSYPTDLGDLTGPYLQQRWSQLLALGNSEVTVEVETPTTNINPSQANDFVWAIHGAHLGRQIRNLRVKVDNQSMPW